MAKLAIYIPSLAGGGAERVVLFIAEAAAQHGLEVDLLLARAEGPYIKNLPKRVRVLDFKVDGSLLALPHLVRYLRKNRPDYIFSALERANIATILAKSLARIPGRLVISERTHISSQNRFEKGFFYAITPMLVRHFYGRADAIVAISRGVAEDLVHIIGESVRSKIEVIYNPAHTEYIRMRVKESVDHPWFQGNHRVVITTGRLSQAKDHSTLIKAFSRLTDQEHMRLVILGEGELRNPLTEEVERLGVAEKVWMPGFVENPWKFMARSDLFVLSSLWEGFGNVLVEAMACGVPIVSTDCQSGPAEILEEGRLAPLVPPADVEALSSAMRKALGVPSKGLTPGIYADKLASLSPEFVVGEYLRVLLG